VPECAVDLRSVSRIRYYLCLPSGYVPILKRETTRTRSIVVLLLQLTDVCLEELVFVCTTSRGSQT
jgi:hypothetical protein